MKEKLNVLFVCGYGVGSSAMSEMVVSKGLKELNIKAEVKHTSVGEMDSMMDWVDVVAISKKLFEGVDVNNYPGKHFIEVINIMDGKGIAKKIKVVVDEYFPELSN